MKDKTITYKAITDDEVKAYAKEYGLNAIKKHIKNIEERGISTVYWCPNFLVAYLETNMIKHFGIDNLYLSIVNKDIDIMGYNQELGYLYYQGITNYFRKIRTYILSEYKEADMNINSLNSSNNSKNLDGFNYFIGRHKKVCDYVLNKDEWKQLRNKAKIKFLMSNI